MRKYLIRYLIFWAPAVIAAYVLGGDGAALALRHFFDRLPLEDPALTAQIAVVGIQWFFAFFMLIGWGINTGMWAYHRPYGALTAVFVYAGFNVLAASIVYATDYRSGTHIVLRAVGGFFSYKPLEVLLNILKDFRIAAEFVIIAIITACCLLGFVIGILQRRVNPDPYSPRIIRR